MPDVTILSPQKPALGMMSWPDAAALPPGYWARLSNVRLDRRNLTVRKNCADLQATYGGDSPTACLGAWSGAINGTQTILTAQVVSGTTRIYRSTDGVTFTELSLGTGVAYPNTRLTSTTAEVSFAVVRDTYRDRDVVVVANGVDTPKVYDALDTDGTSSNFVSHAEVSAPDASGAQHVLMAGRGSIEIYDSGNLADVLDSGDDMYTNSAAIIDYINVEATVADGAVLYYSHNASPQDFSGRQLAILFDEESPYGGWAEFMGNVEIHLSEGTAASNPPTEVELQGLTWTKVYDHEDTATYPISAVAHTQGGAAGTWALVDLRAVAETSRDAVRHLKFVWTGSQPASNTAWHVRCIACLGAAPGGGRHAATFFNSKSRSESRPALMPAPVGVTLDRLGGANAWVGSDEPVRIPNSSSFYVDYEVTLTKYSQAAADAGVDRIRLYRRDQGDAEYRLAQEQVSATVNYGTGVWSASNGSFGTAVTITDDAPGEDLEWEVRAPSPQHLCIQTGGVTAAANGRLWVASGSTLRVSELDQPFRFLDSTRFLADADGNVTQEVDSASPVRHALHGETVRAVAPIDAGDVSNSSANQLVYVLTDSSVYALSGFDASSLSRRAKLTSVGAIGPGAYCTGNQSLYWVGDDRVLWRLRGGQAEAVSRFVVSELHDVPASRRDKLRLLWHDSKVLCALTPSAGSANTDLLLYDELLGAFYADSLPSSRSAERLVRFRSSAGDRVLCLGSSGQVTEHAQESSLGSSLEATVAVTLVTAQINSDLLDGFVVRSVAALADDSDGSSLTAVASWEPYASTSTFTISLDSASGSAWKRSTEPATVTFDANDRGGSGVGAQLTFTCSLPSGKRIRALHLETEQRGNRRAERA